VIPGRSDASLYTASFASVDPARVVPVLTTVGTPRFTSYPLVEWRTVAPWGLLDVADPEEFRRRYRHRLHRLTPKILAELADLRAAYDPWPLALLCFEADPADCHRALLGEWIAEQTGEEVRELS